MTEEAIKLAKLVKSGNGMRHKSFAFIKCVGALRERLLKVILLNVDNTQISFELAIW